MRKENKLNNTEGRLIYFTGKIGLSTFFYLLLSGAGIFILSIAVFSKLFDSILLILILGGLLTLSFWFYKSSKDVFTIELSYEGVEIKYPLSIHKNHLFLEYSNITSAYFYCGPFGLNSPSIVIQYVQNSKIEKIVFVCYTPSNIENILNSISKHGVNTGISIDSTNYFGLKDRLKVIKPS